MVSKTLGWDDLGVSLDDVGEQMGYHGQQPDEATLRETECVMQEASRQLRAAFCYRVVAQLPDFELGGIIARQLEGAEAYALFVATAGREYEDFQRRLQREGDMLRTFVADALGSVIAERTADCMEDALQASIDKLGWHHTNRFSPGYCGWHVEQQQQLFAWLQGETCGVRLTESSLMVPIKSVSGIIGLGSRVRRNEYACGLCDFSKCYKRKERITGK